MESRSGVITDHTVFTQYLPNSYCGWLIRPTPAPPSITLFFTRLQIEYALDTVIVYDGANSSAPVLLHASVPWFPYPIKSSAGTMYIEFRSNAIDEFTGFTAIYTSSGTTTISCS
jgi:hypothetical protein